MVLHLVVLPGEAVDNSEVESNGVAWALAVGAGTVHDTEVGVEQGMEVGEELGTLEDDTAVGEELGTGQDGTAVGTEQDDMGEDEGVDGEL